MLNSFGPIIDTNCTILILGTMPGIQSLVKQEYYGNERNAFWKIIYFLFEQPICRDYEKKKEFLLQHNIALWDVLKACNREGSSDADIKNPIPNDFASLFEEYPHIKAVYFNGGPAEKLFKKYVEKNHVHFGKAFYRLPSTSPAYVAKLEEKLNQWKLILLS